jgi:hypothetical protein
MKKKSSDDGVKKQYQIRMDADMKAIVLKYQEKLRKETNMDVTYADAARALIRHGAEAVGVK